MPLFSEISVTEMSDPALAELSAICSEMVKQLPADHHHRSDYEELRGRLEGEQRRRAAILAERNRAATVLQAAFRGKQARDQAAELIEQRNRAATVLQAAFRGKQARDEAAELREQARLLEQRTKAALTIQSIFRGNQARSNYALMKQQAAEALQQEQIRQTQLQLILISKGETQLTDKKVDLARVSRDEKLQVGRLLEAYEEAKSNAPSRKNASRQALTKLAVATSELEGYVDLIVAQVKKTIAEEKKQAEAAISVVVPADFSQEGAMVHYGTFMYPGAGRLKIGGSTYQLHPNRSLVHVRHEVADNATLATAQAYLNSSLAACRSVIATKNEGTHSIDGRTDAGLAFKWNVIYQSMDEKKTGYKGQIIHIDSGYEWSQWLPANKRGKCRTCKKPKNRHDNSHPIT